jgi:hypothetical protein
VVTTAVYLLNRSPTKSVHDKTPFKVWHGYKPDVSYLHVFGCVTHVKVTKPHLAKLDDRSTPMVLFGNEPGSAAYRVYDPVGGHVHVSRDVVFDEGARWDWEKTGGTPDAPSFHVEHFSFPTTSTATFPAATATTSTATSSAARAASEPATPSMSGDAGGGGSSPALCMASPTDTSPTYL